MRILITNDDGINAEGIHTLQRAAMRLGGEVCVVAPEVEHSAQSHAITVRQPVFARDLTPIEGEARRIAVTGTPCDCVRLALLKLLPEKPDLCLSGINHGGNMGWDVFFSGTVSAAAEAYSFGIPAIAFSLATWGRCEWGGLDVLVAGMLRRFLGYRHDTHPFLYSVNLPALPQTAIKGVKLTRQEPHVKGDNFLEREAPDGRRYFWPTWDERQAARDRLTDEIYDSAAVKAGWISVTPLRYEVSRIEDPQAARAFEGFMPGE